MDAKFTIPYSEYAVIEKLITLLKKGDSYSFYIPISRQEKGVDFLIHNSSNKKCLRFQVKGSRSYPGKPEDGQYKYNFWFNNFIKRYSPGQADYYILFGLYPSYFNSKSINSKRSFWEKMILCFSDIEMNALLASILLTKKNKPDNFFSISFNVPEIVFGIRGFKTKDSPPKELSQHLIDNKIDLIIQSMTSN